MMKHGVCIPSMHFAHLGGYWSWENLCQSTKPTEHKGVARIKLGEATIVQYAGAGRLDKGSAFKTWTDVLREKTSGHQGFHSQVDKNNWKKFLQQSCCCCIEIVVVFLSLRKMRFAYFTRFSAFLSGSVFWISRTPGKYKCIVGAQSFW